MGHLWELILYWNLESRTSGGKPLGGAISGGSIQKSELRLFFFLHSANITLLHYCIMWIYTLPFLCSFFIPPAGVGLKSVGTHFLHCHRLCGFCFGMQMALFPWNLLTAFSEWFLNILSGWYRYYRCTLYVFPPVMKTAQAVKILLSRLLTLHFSRGVDVSVGIWCISKKKKWW